MGEQTILQSHTTILMEKLKTVVIKAEYEQILEALKRTKFSKAKAARLLGIDRKTLYNKLDAYEKLTATEQTAS